MPDIWLLIAALGLIALIGALITGRGETPWVGIGGGLLILYALHLGNMSREVLDFSLIFPLWVYAQAIGLALMLTQPVDRRLTGLGLILIILWFFHVARIPFGGPTGFPFTPDAWMGLALVGMIIITIFTLVGREVSMLTGVGAAFIILYTLHLLGVPRAWLDIQLFVPLWVYLFGICMFMIFGRVDDRVRGIGIVFLALWLFHVARVFIPGLTT